MKDIELVETQRDKIFSKGEIVKLGMYWIGWDLTFGIHIPTVSKEQGESIMKVILDKVEKWDKINEEPYHENVGLALLQEIEKNKSLLEEIARLKKEFQKTLKKCIESNTKLRKELLTKGTQLEQKDKILDEIKAIRVDDEAYDLDYLVKTGDDMLYDFQHDNGISPSQIMNRNDFLSKLKSILKKYGVMS